MLSETNISKMLEFLIDNIFVMFGVCVFQQTAGIPMDTKCAPPLSNLFLLFIQGRKKVAWSLNITFCYTDDVFAK
jgi:hypothetical protein